MDFCGKSYEEMFRDLTMEVMTDMEIIEDYDNEHPVDEIAEIVRDTRRGLVTARFDRKMEVLKVLVQVVKAE